MRLQGAIFDMDGTLLDSMAVWATLGSDFLRSRGAVPEDGLDETLKTMSLREAGEYCRQRYALPESVDEIVAMVDERVDRFYRFEVQPKPGVDRFLSLLKMEGVWMYLATATDRAQAEAALTRCGLRDYFRGILTCSEVGGSKNSPLIYEKALTRLQCRKTQAVVFEDALHAIKTAKEAGFRVAAVADPSAEADREEIRRLADYYIESFAEWTETV